MTDANVRIFSPTLPEANYEWVMPIAEGRTEWLAVVGTAAQDPVEPAPEVEILTEDEGEHFKRAWMPWYGSHLLVLRDEAIDAVGPLVLPFGSLIELPSKAARIAIFAAQTREQMLDVNRSEIIRFPSSGRVMSVRSPVFRDELVAEVDAFRLEEMRRSALYLTEALVDEIIATGLTSGTEFELVYDSTTRGS